MQNQTLAITVRKKTELLTFWAKTPLLEAHPVRRSIDEINKIFRGVAATNLLKEIKNNPDWLQLETDSDTLFVNVRNTGVLSGNMHSYYFSSSNVDNKNKNAVRCSLDFDQIHGALKEKTDVTNTGVLSTGERFIYFKPRLIAE